MLKTVLITLIILGLVAAMGAAWAKHRGMCSHEGRMQYLTERVARKLDLSDEQRAKLEVFAGQLKAVRGERRRQRGSMQDEILALLSSPTLDRERAERLIDDRLRQMQDSRRGVVDAFADFSDSLRVEQRAQLGDMIVERMAHRWEHARWAHD